MLASRHLSTQQFITDFYKTLLPGIIPRHDFIKWEHIEHTNATYAEDVARLRQCLANHPTIEQSLTVFLATSPKPLTSLRLLFRLIGHTGEVFVSQQDRLDLRAEAMNIHLHTAESEAAIQNIVNILVEIGIAHVLAADLSVLLAGVSIGLETHRRKNSGGTTFKTMVQTFLEACLPILQQSYPTLTLQDEVTITYANQRQSKNVDIALLMGGVPLIGFEVNFYTSRGSKPSEIKRSYAQVRRDLAAVGVALVWVTDGEGYMKMTKSLADAQETHPDIYNFSMFQRFITPDIIEYLATRQPQQ
jgi:type II restriction enzyme